MVAASKEWLGHNIVQTEVHKWNGFWNQNTLLNE